jgi:hypothetical protein
MGEYDPVLETASDHKPQRMASLGIYRTWEGPPGELATSYPRILSWVAWTQSLGSQESFGKLTKSRTTRHHSACSQPKRSWPMTWQSLSA